MRKNSLAFAVFLIGMELVAGLLSIIAFLSLLLIIFRQNLGAFDKTIIQWVYTFRSEGLTELMKGITFLGGEIFITCGILILLTVVFKKHKITTFNFSVLLFFGTIINLLLKWLYQRPRPDYLPLAFESTYSFPSGHAMNSFIFYACLAYFIIRNTKNQKIRLATVLSLCILVGLIGLSRVYLGVHYPSDVLAGYIGGLLWFGVIILVERTAHKFNVFKKVL
jgi:undecaprenyl-diphosphatase